MATAPVWRVQAPDALWQFNAKKRAEAFVEHGGCTHGHGPHGCVNCGGYIVGGAR